MIQGNVLHNASWDGQLIATRYLSDEEQTRIITAMIMSVRILKKET